MDYKEINKIPMFFIVGRARSGTTLLQTLLDSHPEVKVPGESCVLIHLKNKYFRCNNWSNNKVIKFLADVTLDKKLYQFWNLDFLKIKEQIFLIPIPARNFTLLCKILYLNYPSIFKHDKVLVLGDKNPIYTIFIDDLLELFPKAKFIHIIRDYRANIVSNRETFSLKNTATLAHAWKYNNLKVEEALAKYPEQFLLVKYEELAQNSITQMKKICEFLNINYTDAIFNFHIKINEQIKDKEKAHFNKHHANLLKPVNNDNTQSWKKKLALSDTMLAEFITGKYALKYGYLQTLPKNTTMQNYIKSMVGYVRNRIIYVIIKFYYHSPLFIKTILAVFTSKINKWFKIKNYYNQTDYSK